MRRAPPARDTRQGLSDARDADDAQVLRQEDRVDREPHEEHVDHPERIREQQPVSLRDALAAEQALRVAPAERPGDRDVGTSTWPSAEVRVGIWAMTPAVRDENYRSGADFTLEFLGRSYAFSRADFTERVAAAARRLGRRRAGGARGRGDPTTSSASPPAGASPGRARRSAGTWPSTRRAIPTAARSSSTGCASSCSARPGSTSGEARPRRGASSTSGLGDFRYDAGHLRAARRGRRRALLGRHAVPPLSARGSAHRGPPQGHYAPLHGRPGRGR